LIPEDRLFKESINHIWLYSPVKVANLVGNLKIAEKPAMSIYSGHPTRRRLSLTFLDLINYPFDQSYPRFEE